MPTVKSKAAPAAAKPATAKKAPAKTTIDGRRQRQSDRKGLGKAKGPRRAPAEKLTTKAPARKAARPVPNPSQKGACQRLP